MFSKKQMLGLLLLPLATSAVAAQQVDNGTYVIRNKFTGKVLDLVNGSAADGTNIIQYRQTNASNQHWQVSYLGNGNYRITNVAGGGAAEVYDWDTSDGANISQWSANGLAIQNWQLSDQGDGTFKVINAATGKAMEVYNWDSSDGANVSQWTDNGLDIQRWAFESLDTGASYHWPLSGDLGTHDPTAMAENGTWYEFQTGPGIYRKVSYDGGLTWQPLPSVLPNGLGWWQNYVPDQQGIDVWAPDVKAYNGKVWLYYAVSTFGSKVSAIGLLSAESLASDNWQDEGLVINTTTASNYNAIDPDLVIDRDNKPWLVLGSWSSGIKLTRLNSSTMKPTGSLYSLAARSGGIEAPSITYRNGYYYLFVSTGVCCAGTDSTYQIRYGRSTSITGPYLDKNGVDMMNGGGSLLDGGNARWVGPGGEDMVGNNVIVRHAYDADDNGNAKLLISKLNWDASGWPRY